ncbi:MAG: histone deacetylase family protein [Spirochaetota bacterium]|nr:histone deacetylase family protein [Spirochaetota bacterium]
MFKIRRIYDAIYPRNIQAIEQIEHIFLEQFPGTSRAKFEKIRDSLRDPVKNRQKVVIFVIEDFHETVHGFAVLSTLTDQDFGYLDYIASKAGERGGLGSSLYKRVREEAVEIGLKGILFECLPDEPEICREENLIEQNRARLRFYENFGAFPIVGTKYETPVGPKDTCPPFMMYDDLGSGAPLRKAAARKAIKQILRIKYKDVCDDAYIKMVADSFRDDPVRVREPRYVSKKVIGTRRITNPDHQIALVVNRKHEIHHVRERGYVEAPVRVKTILDGLNRTGLFHEFAPKEQGMKALSQIHDRGYLSYLRKACAAVGSGKSVYPYVFPIRNTSRPPKELEIRAGYYCIDTFTPLNASAYKAARSAVDTVLTAADLILEGKKAVYALTRPPGHHAEKKAFGGFCYFNSAAAAAQRFAQYGRTAILDIDYHHGNGNQNIFYERSDVLTISLHADPRFAYPYFSGFRDERGAGDGTGYNINYPLPENVDGQQYLGTLTKALNAVRRFKPRYLIVCLGLDTAKGDPTGTWLLRSGDFYRNGLQIGGLKIPTLVVQEGGYDNRVLGVNARHFFTGFAEGAGLLRSTDRGRDVGIP